MLGWKRIVFQVTIEGSFIGKTPQGNYTEPELLFSKTRHESNLNFGSAVIAEIINEARVNERINTYTIYITDLSRDVDLTYEDMK